MDNTYFQSFKSRHAVITGAASGIGRSTAILLAKAGAIVTLVDRNKVSLKDVAQEIGIICGESLLVVVADISNPEQVSLLGQKIKERQGSCDYLVNCAGVLRRNAFLDISNHEWNEVIAINLNGSYLCCREIIPLMLGGDQSAVVLVASMAGRSTSVWGGAHYTASKHGVIGLARHLAREFGPENIRVNAFCPGGTLTPMVESCTKEESRNKMAKDRPLGRWATAEEQAKVIMFLLSKQSGFMTGTALDSNGGALMV